MARGKATEKQLAALAKARDTRAAKKMYAPSFPKGGYRSLMTKKRLAAKAAAWEALSPAMLSGANTQARGTNISVRTYRSRAKKDMTTPIVVVEAAPKTRGKATEKQLAALAKARAARAAKKAGTTVAVAVAAPKVRRPRRSKEEVAMDKKIKADEKAFKKSERDFLRAKKQEEKAIEKTNKALERVQKKKKKT